MALKMICAILFRTTFITIFASAFVQVTAFLSVPYSTNSKHTDSFNNGKIVLRPHRNLNEINDGRIYDPENEILPDLNEETLKTDGFVISPLYESGLNILRILHQDLENEQDIVIKSALLIDMLEDPTLDTLPIVYVEEYDANENILNEIPMFSNNFNGINKRSRFYRRYPWKRHNRNRSTYDPQLRYACTPSKEDVFKLLVNLHENRNGRNGKTISFCNRKRPARAVFTNLRFLG